MKARHAWLFPALLVMQADVYGLTTPSASDGPIKLLACVVTPSGILEAAVDSQTDDRMSCDIDCNYMLGERLFSQSFTVTIPARFQGRVGSFDTSGGKAGNYQGSLRGCEKLSG